MQIFGWRIDYIISDNAILIIMCNSTIHFQTPQGIFQTVDEVCLR